MKSSEEPQYIEIGNHEDSCSLEIPLIKRLESARQRTVVAQDFESAAAIRDAIRSIRKHRSIDQTNHPPADILEP